MHGYDLVVPALRRAGVTCVFGLIGDATFHFVTQFDEERGVRFVATMHENSAVSAAVSYARARNSVGVATTTVGPGLTNCLTAVRAAVMSRTPLVLLAGALPAGSFAHQHYLEQDRALAAVGASVEVVKRASDIGAGIARAIERALRERTAVGVSLPLDLQFGLIDAKDLAAFEQASVPAPAIAGRAIVGDLEQALDWLDRASRPVVLAGHGAVLANAIPALELLGDRYQSLFTTSLLANGAFATNPWSVGVSGGFSTSGASQLLGEADLLVSFGASLNDWTLAHGMLYRDDLKVVQVDEASLPSRDAAPHRVVIQGDARVVAEALLERSGDRTAECRGREGISQDELSAARTPGPTDDGTTDASIDPRRLFHELSAALPIERSLVTDGGHFLGFPIAHLPVPDPQAFHFGAFFGSIGLGMGTALGVAIARPDRLTVVVVGDGGLAMTLGEMQTLVRYSLPLLVVVVNDGAYGAELHQMDLAGLPVDEAILGDVDFAAVASALGARGITVRKAEDLEALRTWLESPLGPCVLDCKVSSTVRADWLTKLVHAKTNETLGQA